ncbi:hypothetical protein AB0C76_04220 [Kitasatospora sp. NPDC048722]|uniref:hypothetical protein n=1 Tax=Kitasatospora sp. NPDC048722 TaxID=3155639 RepID=UPI0033E6855C
MTRIAQVLVLAPWDEEAMAPLCRPDASRSWYGCFAPLPTFTEAWVAEFDRMGQRAGLLRHLESLPWRAPESVQVLIHDEEDDCFGLWMMRDGKLTEIPVPGHRRLHPLTPATEFAPDPGLLWRSGTPVPAGFSEERRDPRPAW